MKCLLTNCDSRKAFDVYNIVCRNLSKSEVILGCSPSKSLGCSFIYLKKIWDLRTDSLQNFSDDLLLISKCYENEELVFLPLEEETIALFYLFIEEYGELNFKFSLPAPENFRISRDKFLLNKYCTENKISAPRLFESFESLEACFTPFIAKPRKGSGSEGIIIVRRAEDLDRVRGLDVKKYVIQELIPNGRRVKGAFFIFRNGHVISSYSHERIRTFPIDGGVSVYSKISNNREILEIGADLLTKLEWSGVAMVEFLMDPTDGKFKIIEVNPRLWGSIILSESSNMNFISSYIDASLGVKISGPSPNLNSKFRWLTGDLLNLIKSQVGLKCFLKVDRDTCFANIAYASVWSCFWFHVFSFLNRDNFKKVLSKI